MFKLEFQTAEVLAAYFRDPLTAEQEIELKSWIEDSDDNKKYFEQLHEENNLKEKLEDFDALVRNTSAMASTWAKTQDNIRTFNESRYPTKTKRVGIYKLWTRISGAAAILVTIGSLALIFNVFQLPYGRDTLAFDRDIPAGETGATLTLANGSKIILSKVVNGELAKEVGASISKLANGQLVYKVSPPARGAGGGSKATSTSYNTLSTTNGEQYQVILPDGSAVYLNAASSITYPTSFSNSRNREVTVKGEVYFEISKDKAHPFVVKSKTQRIQVLGTHFNVNTYEDEPVVKTTLLEGSLKIVSSTSQDVYSSSSSREVKRGEVLLQPGEQAIQSGSSIRVAQANIQEAIAWKNGFFRFKEERLESIMRKVSKWYNVEIIYAPDAPKEVMLGGFISRNKNISAVLEMMTLTEKVKFKIEGRSITVLKYK